MKKQRKALAGLNKPVGLNKHAQLGLLIGAALAMSTGAYAGGPTTVGVLPTAPNTQSGSASYYLNGVAVPTNGTGGKVNAIAQTAQQLITNWESFSIGSRETVTLTQKLEGSSALFRVIGNSASSILGTLNATGGSLFLVNRNGVLFGGNSNVNVGNFVASTMDISKKNFLKGKYKFVATLGENGQYNNVINQGYINSKEGGYIVLLSSNQVVNGQNGKGISSEGGSVVLAASQKATLMFDKQGLVTAKLSGDQLDNVIVRNTGEIHANGGAVQLATNARSAVVNVNGLIEAGTLKKGRDGIIRLQAGKGGSVAMSGKLLAKKSNDNTTGDKVIITAGNNINIADGSTIKLGANKGFKAEAGNSVLVSSNIETSRDGSIRIKADADKSGEGNVRLNASLRSETGEIKIGGVNIADLPPTGAGEEKVAKKPKQQQIYTKGTADKKSGKITIAASNNVNLQNTAIATEGKTAKALRYNNKGKPKGGANVKGGDAGDINITAKEGVVLLGNVTSEGGNGISDKITDKNAENKPNGGHAGNITIAAAGTVRAGEITSFGGNAAGLSNNNGGPSNAPLASDVEEPQQTTAYNGGKGGKGGKGGNGGNITINAGDNVNVGLAYSQGGNGGMATNRVSVTTQTDSANKEFPATSATTQTDSPNKATGGKAGNISITAKNNVVMETGASSIGGNGGKDPWIEKGPSARGPAAEGGNAGDVDIKAGGNVSLFEAGSAGGNGGTNSRGGDAGNVNVEAGGAIAATALFSYGGQSDRTGDASKASNGGDITVTSSNAGDIKIGVIEAFNGGEVGGKWRKKGQKSKPGSVSVINKDGNIAVNVITTHGGENGDGGNVTVDGSNDVVLGAIDTDGGRANSGETFNNRLGLKEPGLRKMLGTAGNNAGDIDVTAGGNLAVGQITANGSDAFSGEEDTSKFIAKAPKLNGGDGGEVTLRYGQTISFIEADKEDFDLQRGQQPNGLGPRASKPIIKIPDPMIGTNGPILEVPEGHITANGGLPNYYGVEIEAPEPPQGEGDRVRSFSQVQEAEYTYFALGENGQAGQIRILGPVSPTVGEPGVPFVPTLPTLLTLPAAPEAPNARLSAALSGVLQNIPGAQSFNIVNAGATAAGGEEGEGDEEDGGSNNPNAFTVLNFGASSPEGVD